jgi:hypothetical protein
MTKYSSLIYVTLIILLCTLVAATTPIHQWSFDNNAADTYGGITLTTSGTVTYNDTDYSRGSHSLSIGGNGYAAHTNGVGFTSVGSTTLTGRFKLRPESSGVVVLWQALDDTTTSRQYLRYDQTTSQFIFRRSSTTTLNYHLSNTTWYFFALVDTGTKFLLYLNETNIWNITQATMPYACCIYEGIATDSPGSLSQYSLHDDYRVYNAVLTPEELANILLTGSNQTTLTSNYTYVTIDSRENSYYLSATNMWGIDINTISVLFEFNNTVNETPTQLQLTNDSGIYRHTRAIYTNNTQNYGHQWIFKYINPANGLNHTIISNAGNQKVYQVNISDCAGENTIKILNITYKDEVSNEPLNTTSVYDLSFSDGTHTLSQSSTQTTHDKTMCTNVYANETTIDFTATGTITLSADNYATRIYSYSIGNELTASNNPQENVTLYMIPLSNSTTIKYNWYDTDYALIDGTLKIYKCSADGTQNLVETSTINSGVAYANIVLTTQAYSYIVVVDGVAYNETTYNQCHIEYEAEATYYVTLAENNLPTYLEFLFLDCELTGPTTDLARLTWESNSEDTTSIMGCIEGYQGATLVMQECSNTTSYSLDATITGNPDYIYGKIIQGSKGRKCIGTIMPPPTEDDSLGMIGLFSMFIVLLGISLYLIGSDGIVQVSGISLVIGGMVAAGFTQLKWVTVISGILFLLIIALMTRHSRSEK